MRWVGLVALSACSVSLCANQVQVAKETVIRKVKGTSGGPRFGPYVALDFLYWQAQEGGTEWAIKTYRDPNGVRSSSRQLNFGWDPGFRVTAGYNFKYDHWDTAFSYTWFFTHAHQALEQPATAGPVADGILSLTTLAGRAARASIDWGIHYSIFDWNLGRNWFISKHLSLRPRIGLKGGWIHQDVDINFQNVLTAKKGSNFAGIGPGGGVTSRWFFHDLESSSFNFLGDLGIAFPWGHFDVTEHERLQGSNFPIDLNHLSRNQIAPMIEAKLGIGWVADILTYNANIGIDLIYEIQYWFRQNQMVNVQPNQTGGEVFYLYDRNSEDLDFQGLTASLRFDF
jgi:hypothetical protein